jgi:hypothetical protein
MIADGKVKGSADPAYAAHEDTLGSWAQAVWNRWLPLSALRKLFAVASANLAGTRRPWAVARGPGAAVVLTMRRLKWVSSSPFLWITDAGRSLDLQADPPVVVVREVHAAVQRWRWANTLKA